MFAVTRYALAIALLCMMGGFVLCITKFLAMDQSDFT